jgi:hypothetical protein
MALPRNIQEKIPRDVTPFLAICLYRCPYARRKVKPSDRSTAAGRDAPAPLSKKNPMEKQPTIQLSLTAKQQAQLKQATGKAVQTLKLQPLEQRLAPGITFNRSSVAAKRRHLGSSE